MCLPKPFTALSWPRCSATLPRSTSDWLAAWSSVSIASGEGVVPSASELGGVRDCPPGFCVGVVPEAPRGWLVLPVLFGVGLTDGYFRSPEEGLPAPEGWLPVPEVWASAAPATRTAVVSRTRRRCMTRLSLRVRGTREGVSSSARRGGRANDGGDPGRVLAPVGETIAAKSTKRAQPPPRCTGASPDPPGAARPGAQARFSAAARRPTSVMPLWFASATSRSPSRSSVFPASTARTHAPTERSTSRVAGPMAGRSNRWS